MVDSFVRPETTSHASGIALDVRKEVPFYVDGERIQRLEKAAAPQETDPKEFQSRGSCISLMVEQPERVEIRAGDGVNWTCTYDDALERRVLGLLKSLVRAKGSGRRTAYNRGSMHLREIEPLPKFEQTPLFTHETVPTDELERQQGIVRPQGLAALQDPEWVDDEASREYLAILDES